MGIEAMKKEREQMMSEVNSLIESGDIDSANAKMEEVKALDNKIEAAITAKKNAEALIKAAPAVDIGERSVSAELNNGMHFSGEPLDLSGSINIVDQNSEKNDKQYEKAWAHMVMGGANAEERQFIRAYNETMNTGNSGILIPKTLARGIWDDISETYPFWADTTKTSVKGELGVLRSTESTDAKWYDEATPIEEGMEKFDMITLGACELARDITITWKLKEMAIEEFLPFIRRNLSAKMGAACGYGVIKGKGKPSSSESNPWKPEPIGIITSLEAESGTPQIVTSTSASDELLKKIISINGLISAKYSNGAAIYINNSTLWNVIAPIVDGNNRPIFMSDANNTGGIGRIFGRTVKLDSSIPEGYILYGNANCYHVNINKNITLDSEDHKKQRTTDYIAYALVDGAPITTKGFALLKIDDSNTDNDTE